MDLINYAFRYEETGQIYLQVCLKNPFVFLIGKFTINQNLKLVECPLCRLFTCLNSSTFNYPHDQMMILKRRKGLWIPVQTSRVWEGSPTVHIVLQILHKILHRTERFIGLLVAAILGIIAITTTAAVSGVAHHQTIQTTQFVQQWHENASKTWNQQLKIDQEISVHLADSETTVVYLGNQLESLRTIVTLKCDWNTSTYCITPFSYNQTRTPWSEVRAYLLGHMPNLSVDIQQLQQEMNQMSSANLQLLPGEDALSAAAEGLSSLNPLMWIKNLGGGFAGTIVFLIIILFQFCLVLQCGQKTLRRAINEETAKSVFLSLKQQKGGDVALQPIPRPPPLH